MNLVTFHIIDEGLSISRNIYLDTEKVSGKPFP